MSKKVTQSQTYIVIALKGRKWATMCEAPVPRAVALQLVQNAWKEGQLARVRSVQRIEATAA